MPAPQHYRITWGGVLGTRTQPAEIFQFGLSAPLVGEAGGPFLVKSDLDALTPGLYNAFSEVNIGLTDQVHLDYVKMAHVNDQGLTPRDANGAYIQGEGRGATLLSGSGTTRVPLQNALAVSCESNASGPVGRGRFYLPCPITGGLGEDGRMDEGNRDGHATRAAAFVRAVNTVLATVGLSGVVVASGGSVSKGISPALYPIVRVGVGRVVDTQRRRRNDLDEVPEFVAL